MAANNTPPTKYSKFDPSNVKFSRVENNEYAKTQKMSFPRYTCNKRGEISVVIQTPIIQLTQYGIPPLHEDYCKSDDDRQYIKIPFDPTQEEVMKLKEIFEEIDKIAGDRDQELILGSKYKKYAYVPIVRKPQEKDDDSDDEDASASAYTGPRYEYFKAKINMDFKTKLVKTKVFKKLSEEEAKEKGKKREIIDNIKTITDLVQHITFKSKVKMLVSINKVWAAKSADKSGKKSYGVGLKVLQIEVEGSDKAGGVMDNFKDDAFIEDSDDEEESKIEKEVVHDAKKKEMVDVQKLDDVEESEESDSDSDSESESDEQQSSA